MPGTYRSCGLLPFFQLCNPSYCALNMTGNRYLNRAPMIQITSTRLEITASPSVRADMTVAPKLSNSWCPDSLRRRCRRCLTHICSMNTIGIRAREINRLYSGVSFNSQPLFFVKYHYRKFSLLFFCLPFASVSTNHYSPLPNVSISNLSFACPHTRYRESDNLSF